MELRRRGVIAALFAGSLLVAPGLTAAGDSEQLEPVIFELTLSGDVGAEDAFALDTNLPCNDTGICAQPMFCGPVPVPGSHGRCGPGTFRIPVEAEAGTTVEYALLRRAGSSDEWERHLADSFVVPEGGITIHLAYEYPSATTALPDTAVAAPRHQASTHHVAAAGGHRSFTRAWVQ